ncbi:helix-turn-helix domain-containing protein [Micrococcus luteus]|nr:helix-turn-helix domain-containing protein [Micrococcus luteus]
MNDVAAVDELLADLPEVLTLEEIADLLRVSTATVLRWQHKAGLKTLVLGERLRRVRKADLRDFLVTADGIEESDA